MVNDKMSVLFRNYFIIFFVKVLFHINISECNAKVIKTVQMEYQEEERYFFLLDEDGNLELVDIMEPIDEKIFEIDVFSVVTFYLFTRINPVVPQMIKFADEDSLRKSYFDNDKTTVFLSHGWRSKAEDLQELVNELLVDDDINIINVDWSSISQRAYTTSKAKTAEIGTIVGDFINWLVLGGFSYERVHLVGISLGAQLMGNAGRQTGGRVRRITGLDPAGPLWYIDEKRLQSTDAQYVEVIHTNTLFFGYKYPCGDVDIYPDGGGIMPACKSSLIKSLCSHVMSLKFFIVSIRYPDHFIARECNDLTEATKRSCYGAPLVVGTTNLTKSGRGIYRMDTGPAYPYIFISFYNFLSLIFNGFVSLFDIIIIY